MKIFFAASVLIWIFCTVSFAQSDQTDPCPKVDVSSPTLDTSPGSIVIFTATIDKESEKKPINLEWFVDGGEILEGQGTDTIKTQQKPEDAGKSITATVEAKFLPDGCKVTDSETAATWCPILVRQIDEFSISANQIDKVKLNNLANYFRNNSSEQIYIIEKFENKTSSKTIESKNQKAIDYLKSHGIERTSIILLTGTGKENLTQFFLVPSGAERPVCDDCKEVELK